MIIIFFKDVELQIPFPPMTLHLSTFVKMGLRRLEKEKGVVPPKTFDVRMDGVRMDSTRDAEKIVPDGATISITEAQPGRPSGPKYFELD